MQAASTNAAAMYEGPEQIYAIAVNITLPAAASALDDVTLAVESLTIDASTTTDMPQGTRLQAGYPARSATLVLSGMVGTTEDQSASWAFSPYSTDSPLYRQQVLYCPVTVDLGLLPEGSYGVPEMLRKFTGMVDEVAVDPKAGTVTLTCIDNRSLLRSVPNLPAVAIGNYYGPATMTSEFCVDTLLRAATGGAVSSWPAVRTNCLLAVGTRSSAWADVGLYSDTIAPTAQFYAPGKFGSAFSHGSSAYYTLAAATGASVFIEFWARLGATHDSFALVFLSPASGGASVFAQFAVYGDAVWEFSFLNGGSPVTQTGALPPVAGTHHYFAASIAWTGAGNPVVSVWMDGSAVASGVTVAGVGGRLAVQTIGAVSARYGTVEAVQVANLAAPPLNNTFTPRAVLDPSLNVLQVAPAVAATDDPWQVIQQIADAELAVAGFDEAGIFRFTNRVTLGSAPSVRDVTSSASLKAMQVGLTASSLTNRAVVPYTTWTFGTPGLIYQLKSPWSVKPGETKTLTMKPDNLSVYVDKTVAHLPDSHTTTDGHSYFRASSDSNGATEFPGSLSFAVSQVGSQRIQVTVTNHATRTTAWLVSPASYTDVTVGTPSLWIGGTPVTPNDELTADEQWPPAADGGAKSTRWGEIAYQGASNPWIQDQVSADGLAYAIIEDSPIPRPDMTGLSIVPDFRLQLTDRLRIIDTDLSGADEYAVLFGENIQIQNGQVTHTVDARAVTFPGGWVLGVDGRSELALTTYV